MFSSLGLFFWFIVMQCTQNKKGNSITRASGINTSIANKHFFTSEGIKEMTQHVLQKLQTENGVAPWGKWTIVFYVSLLRSEREMWISLKSTYSTDFLWIYCEFHVDSDNKICMNHVYMRLGLSWSKVFQIKDQRGITDPGFTYFWSIIKIISVRYPYMSAGWHVTC